MILRTHARPLFFSFFIALSMLLVLLAGGRSFVAAQEAPEGRPAVRYSDEVDRPVVERPTMTAAQTVPDLIRKQRGLFHYVENSRVAFYDHNEARWDIFISDGQGDNAAQLTNDGPRETSPDLSRGGQQVVYVRSEGDEDSEIWTMDRLGGNKQPLTDNEADEGQPAWSPDGRTIAFVSDRDGQPEIYTMQSDGSQQRRLTVSGDYDGDPAWSPDGTQIVFSSRRSGGYRLYTMNADGSSVKQITSTPVSIRPTWSPSGRYIAYTADHDGDGWLELRIVDMETGEIRMLHNPVGTVDALAGSWSPDEYYVAYTRYEYTNYFGNWYITRTVLRVVAPRDSNRTEDLIDGITFPFEPSWQSLDATAPSSQVEPLPEVSASPVTVSWTGSEPYNSIHFDIQVQVDGGPWTDWIRDTKEWSAVYDEGPPGARVGFRSRSRDAHFNREAWPAAPDAETTIDGLPPQTSVTPLTPRIRLGGPFPVLWEGIDPGGSGIAGYDVQYRVGTGVWTDWRIGVAESSALFGPTHHNVPPGERLAFRVRATDIAGNIEAWPPGDGDTSTITYEWAVEGRMTDNVGTAIENGTVTANPAAYGPVRSDASGAFAAVSGSKAATATLTWMKSGYGALPSTPFSTTLDHQVDVVLPPVNDVVVDGGFEAGWPGAAWAGGGTLALAPDAPARTTGEKGLRFGATETGFGPTQQIGDERLRRDDASLFTGPDNRPLVLWLGSEDHFLMTSEQNSTGIWQPPLKLAETNLYRAAEDDQHRIHVVYMDGGALQYIRRTLTGSWTSPAQLPGPTPQWVGDLVAGPGDMLGLLSGSWAGEITFYARSSKGWGWPEVVRQNVAQPGPYNLQTVFRSDGTAYLFSLESIANPNTGQHVQRLSAQRRLANGSWPPGDILFQERAYIHNFRAIADSHGQLHVVWLIDEEYQEPVTMMYARFSDGQWRRGASFQSPFGGYGNRLVGLVASTAGEPRAVNAYGAVTVLTEHDPGRGWLASETVLDSGDWFQTAIVDGNDRTHVAARRYRSGPNGSRIVYRWRDRDGVLSPSVQVFGQDVEHTVPQLTADAAGSVHLLWLGMESTPNNETVPSHINYVGPALTAQPADAFVSQSVNIPADMTNPVLSFLYKSSDANAFEVEAGGTLRDLPAAAFDTAHHWLDMSPYAGQTISVTFRLRQGANRPAAWAMLDDVSLGSAHPDVALSGWSGEALPGQTATLRLTAANPGALPAEPVTLTLQLPPELSFVSAVPAPDGNAPPVWNLGALAPGETTTVDITVRVGGTAAPFALLRSTAALETAGELETANNTVELRTRVARTVWLPGIAGE